MRLSWDTLYLLGWYDANGRSLLTTWEGDLPMVHVVVLGVNGLNMPLWHAPVPSGATFEVVPQGEEGQQYAKKRGGLLAFGWYVEKGVDRKSESVNGTPFTDQLN